MKGYLILNGGEAFSSQTKSIDHMWLQLVRGRSRPRLVVVPAAEVHKPRKVADQVMRYFNHLGTFAEYAMITDSRTADTATEYEILDKVHAVVLVDGSPIDVVERLQDTKTQAALHRVLERKAALFAPGASAMALGGVYWLGGVWERGLEIAPHLAVLPHHQLAQMRLSPERLLADLPEGITLIGVDDVTTLICHPDGACQVEGQGEVTVYRNVDQQDVYEAGERFTLEEAE